MMAAALHQELHRYQQWWEGTHQAKAKGRRLLFRSPGAESVPMTRQAVDRALRVAVERLGLPSGVSLHSFRRSLATTMAQRGASLRTVQSFTGHRSLGQLQTYIDITEQDQRAALLLIC